MFQQELPVIINCMPIYLSPVPAASSSIPPFLPYTLVLTVRCHAGSRFVYLTVFRKRLTQHLQTNDEAEGGETRPEQNKRQIVRVVQLSFCALCSPCPLEVLQTRLSLETLLQSAFTSCVYALALIKRNIFDAAYMPRFGNAFPWRKSTADDISISQTSPDQPSFRVLERNQTSDGRNFDGGIKMNRPSGPSHRPTNSELEPEDNLFAGLNANRYVNSLGDGSRKQPLMWKSASSDCGGLSMLTVQC